jgi:hypothetical protein
MRLIYISIFIILVAAFTACKAPQQITNTVTKDSIIYREIPRYIELPGKTIKSPPVNIDSLAKLIRQGIKPEVINRTLIYTDTTGNFNVKIMLDQLGNLTAICEQKDQRIMYLENQLEHYKSISTTEKTTKGKSFFERLRDATVFIIIGLVIGFILGFIVFKFIL